jgi:hypothetical protein
MRITKCDICKKTIVSKVEESLHLGYNDIKTFASFDICFACGKPIIKILKNKKLIKGENKKNGGKK